MTVTRRAFLGGLGAIVVTHHRPNHKPTATPTPTPTTSTTSTPTPAPSPSPTQAGAGLGAGPLGTAGLGA